MDWIGLIPRSRFLRPYATSALLLAWFALPLISAQNPLQNVTFWWRQTRAGKQLPSEIVVMFQVFLVFFLGRRTGSRGRRSPGANNLIGAQSVRRGS